jgi:hypothetical protein
MNEEKPALTKPLWLQYMAFENSMVVDGGAVEACEQLERRFHDKYKEDNNPYAVPSGLSLQTYRYSFLDLTPDTPTDIQLLKRVRHYDHHMLSGPLTFGDGGLSGGGGFGSGGFGSPLSDESGEGGSRSNHQGHKNSHGRARNHRSKSRSRSPIGRRSKSSSSSGGSGSSAPSMIIPSFLAPLMYGMPDDDNEVYWPTKEHDIRNVIKSFQTCTLPPPPSEEECARIQQIRDGLHSASWKDARNTGASSMAGGSSSSSSSSDGGGDSHNSATGRGDKSTGGGDKGDKKNNSGKRKRDNGEEDTPRVKSRKSKGAGDIYTQRMRDKQGGGR